MSIITEIRFDYYHGPEGELYIERKIGDNVQELGIVKEMSEHRPQYKGDLWYYDIMYDDGKVERTFNPHRVFYG